MPTNDQVTKNHDEILEKWKLEQLTMLENKKRQVTVEAAERVASYDKRIQEVRNLFYIPTDEGRGCYITTGDRVWYTPTGTN